jgi:hypothetical protein
MEFRTPGPEFSHQAWGLTGVLEPAVALDAFFAACAFHQDASHGSGVSLSAPAEKFFGGFCSATSRHCWKRQLSSSVHPIGDGRDLRKQ